jgi:hypothetical protein
MNKYANQYLDGLKEKLLAYKPFNQQAAFEAAPEGAGIAGFALLEKSAARGDQLIKLLARFGGTNIDSLLFRNKIIKPGGTVRGVEGWQSAPAIGTGPGGMSHWFSGKPTEHAVSEVRGGDLIKKLKDLLPGAINERGGGMWLNEQQDAANLVKQIRRATR